MALTLRTLHPFPSSYLVCKHSLGEVCDALASEPAQRYDSYQEEDDDKGDLVPWRRSHVADHHLGLVSEKPAGVLALM